MKNSKILKSTTALIMAANLTVATITPIIGTLINIHPVQAQTNSNFRDVPSNHWAYSFIQELSSRNIIRGFSDGTFRPNEPVTRAQFASIVQIFNKNPIRPTVNFSDVNPNHWARLVIQNAYASGFVSGYNNNQFQPESPITREQVLVGLANGLNYNSTQSVREVLDNFSDKNLISSYAQTSIAAAAEEGIVVNYPNIRNINPQSLSTRAELAAIIYQALSNSGQLAKINSPYIVSIAKPDPIPDLVNIPSGTALPVSYDKKKILIAPNETAPLTLNVSANITTRTGQLLIPKGSQITGELKPIKGGTQFLAKTLVFPSGQQLTINATSNPITKTETIRKGRSLRAIMRNTAVSASAAAAIASITGDKAIATEEVLGGVAFGALSGLFLGRRTINLISIDPSTDFSLVLNSDLALK